MMYRFAIDVSLPKAAELSQSVLLVSALGEVDVPPEFWTVLEDRPSEHKTPKRRSVWDDEEFRKRRAG